MSKRILYGIFLLLCILALISLSIPAVAAPLAGFTPYPTPTPGPDGRITYIAQNNDTLWRICAIFNFAQDQCNQVRSLNHWEGVESPVIHPGDIILIGVSGPAEVTPTLGPSPTPGPLLPTPSVSPGNGDLCVILYNDLNGDSLRQENEPSIPKGAISVANRQGTVSETRDTQAGTEPECFKGLPEGDYTISVGLPEGYNPTTQINQTLTLKAGSTDYMDFGAQVKNAPSNAGIGIVQPASPSADGNTKSPILGIIGIALLAGGVGLGLFAGRLAGIGAIFKKKSS